MTSAAPEILIVAAEASSALYAQRLLEHWKKQGVNVRAFGIGSRGMEAAGFEILGRSEDLAVVGVVEVLKHYPQIKKVFYDLIEAAERRQPKAVLLLDYPDFNLRLAKKLKKLGLPILYYISPQVWAWRKSRIHTIKKFISKMLVVLPFEKDFYTANGVDVEFVGHPILDEISPALFDKVERDRARSRYGVLPHDKWVGLMPGSRNSELKHHLTIQLQTAEELYRRDPTLKFALLVAPSFSKAHLQAALPSYDLPLTLVQDEPFKMVGLMDAILCASGTATLIVGLMGKPMVIMYRMAAFTAWLAKRIIKGTNSFGLINLVLGRVVVPELFQEQANPQRMADELAVFLDNESIRARTEKDLLESHHRLGDKGATARVAQALHPYLTATSKVSAGV